MTPTTATGPIPSSPIATSRARAPCWPLRGIILGPDPITPRFTRRHLRHPAAPPRMGRPNAQKPPDSTQKPPACPEPPTNAITSTATTRSLYYQPCTTPSPPGKPRLAPSRTHTSPLAGLRNHGIRIHQHKHKGRPEKNWRRPLRAQGMEVGSSRQEAPEPWMAEAQRATGDVFTAIPGENYPPPSSRTHAIAQPESQSLSFCSTQTSPSRVNSFFQNGARVFKSP